jgi:hypothetical protein
LRRAQDETKKQLYFDRDRSGGYRMRKWPVLLILAGIAWPAMAARSISVEQLDQILAANQGKADAHVAQQLADVELAERVSSQRLAKWEKSFPGDKTREALLRLADTAAFSHPASEDELVRIAPPDSDTQERMLALASDYVKTANAQLPNFSATRETTHFEDAPSQEQAMATNAPGTGWRMRSLGISLGRSETKPLHITGSFSIEVTYRDGREVHDVAGTKEAEHGQQPGGLTTSGEFGPILSVVIADAMSSQVTWGYWEQQGTGDPMAVMRYAVPEDRSNYAVGIPNGAKVDKIYPAYHGEIAIDPATGSILRISVVADLMGPYQSMQTAMQVEYAPVAIGDHTYICPVHGVAYSKLPVAGSTPDAQNGTVTVQTQLNDVVFTHYHLFGSEARIVAGDKTPGDGSAAETGASPGSSSDPAANHAAPAAPPEAPQY